MAHKSLVDAKNAKNDEFYTQYADIQKEMNAYIEFNPDVFRDKTILLPCDDPEWSNFTKFFTLNFKRYGIKKLISTSFAVESKLYPVNYQPTLFESADPNFDINKTRVKGKIFTLDNTENSENLNVDNLKWHYLDGDGDFRSEEVKKLRDEADFIITNPPFSLFRKFLAWIVEANKKFAIIGNMNSIACKEVFPLIKENKMWIGATGFASDMVFGVPKGTEVPKAYKEKAERLGYKGDYTRLGNSCWYTSIEHGKRHEPIPLKTIEKNKMFSKHKEVRDKDYQKYDNYDAIEVPFSDAIPSDYEGVMGVPISFLDKYCPEQFEILGSSQRGCHDDFPDTKKYDDFWEVRPDGTKTGSSGNKTNENANLAGNDGKKNYFINKDGYTVQSTYARIFIRKIRETK